MTVQAAADRAGRVRGFRPTWRTAVIEALLLAAVLVAFSWLHGRVGRDTLAATAHADGLIALERSLHLNIELSVNGWLAGRQLLIVVAVALYRLYYLPLLAVLIWLFVRHPGCYRPVRRVLIAMIVLGLCVFWAYPVSPPRFALAGIVDIVAAHDIFPTGHSLDRTSGANFTAFPSLHVGWSAWCAYSVWTVCRRSRPRSALLAWLFPLLMAVVVWTTGNHYVLDVVGSAGVLAAGIAAAHGWGRLFDRVRTGHGSSRPTG